MNDSTKISLSSFLILLVSIFLVLVFTSDNSSKSNNVDLFSSEDFFSQDFNSNKEKILFVGSSHVARVNATYVQELLAFSNYYFDVYNLGMSADTPSKRLKSIDDLISLGDTEGMLYAIEKYVLFDFLTLQTFELISTQKFPILLLILFVILNFISYKKGNLLEIISNLKLKYWLIFLFSITMTILFFYDGNPENFIYFRF
jgi:hypothetical protein